MFCLLTTTLKKKKSMTKEEALSALTPIMDEYLDEINALIAAVFNINPNPKDYAKGVMDGVENTTLIAFNAGAKAMYNLLKQESNGTSDNI